MILAIDPGYRQSAYLYYDDVASRPSGQTSTRAAFGFVDNAEMLRIVRADEHARELAIESISIGGMVAGQETFDTAMFVGRCLEAWEARGRTAALVRRIDEKMCLCGDSRAKDANIRQALIDRFGPGKEAAIGKKKSPGPLYGISSHVWSALAVAVTHVERTKGK